MDCSCGSGLQARPLIDGNKIFVEYVCDQCEALIKAKYRPEIMDRPYTEEELGEPIDEEAETNYAYDKLTEVFTHLPPVFTLTEMQYAQVRNVEEESWKLYIYNLDGYHYGGHWFSKHVKHPGEEIPIRSAWAKTVEAIANAQEVKICDGGDMLVFHALDGHVIYGADFWKTLGME